MSIPPQNAGSLICADQRMYIVGRDSYAARPILPISVHALNILYILLCPFNMFILPPLVYGKWKLSGLYPLSDWQISHIRPDILFLTANIIHRICGLCNNPFMLRTCRIGLFPAKTGSFRAFRLGPQLGGLGKPRIFLLNHLQFDLVRLQFLCVVGCLIHQNAALLQTHSRFKVPLALGGLIAAVMPPVFCGERYIVFFTRYRGMSADQNESTVRQNDESPEIVVISGLLRMVRGTGLEPVTPCTSSMCSTS